MGSDDIHRKRKARALKELKRKEATKQPYDRVLIVCEGTKTEPLYFRSLIDDYKLSNANIKVEPSPDSCPLRLVNYAFQFNQDRAYDRIYCVMDKDRHAHYKDAVQKVNGRNSLFLANSVPCFEYWLLLHYELSTNQFYGTASKTPGDEAVSQLKKYIPDYRKGKTGIYNFLKPYNEIAKQNAKIVNSEAIKAGTDNPSTKVVELVEYLEQLRDLAAS